MRRCLAQLSRRARTVLSATAVLRCSLTFDADELTPGTGETKRIRRANLDGSQPEDIVTRPTYLDGSGIVSVPADWNGPVGLALSY